MGEKKLEEMSYTIVSEERSVVSNAADRELESRSEKCTKKSSRLQVAYREALARRAGEGNN